MANRAYFLINVSEELDRDGFLDAARKLEQKPDIDFVDAVAGDCDLVVMVETGGSIEEAAREIEALPWVDELRILNTVTAAHKHRASKDRLLELLANGA